MEDRIIGVIGLGIMGTPMARNLLRAGFRLNVHTRTRTRAASLEQEGAVWRDSPDQVAAESEMVVTMLPDSPDVAAVYLGGNGILSKVRRETLCIDMSTIAPRIAQDVAAKLEALGCGFLDAPVSGGKTGAEAGTLSIMVGGSQAHLDRAMPVFNAMGKNVVHCGPVGYGQLTKLCNQILCGLNLLAVGEAMVFARKVGLDPTIMLQAVSGGAAASWALSNLGQRMIQRDFAPMFMVDLQQKDLRIALDMAASRRLPLPGTALVSQILAANQAAGEGREGTQVLLRALERLAGICESADTNRGGAN